MSDDLPNFYDMQPGHSLLMELQSEEMNYVPQHDELFVGFDDQTGSTPEVSDANGSDFDTLFYGFQQYLQDWGSSVSPEVAHGYTTQLLEFMEAGHRLAGSAPPTASATPIVPRGSSASISPATASPQLFEDYPTPDTTVTTPAAGSEDDSTLTATPVTTGGSQQPIPGALIPVPGAAGLFVLFRMNMQPQDDRHPGWFGVADNVEQRCLLACPPGTSCSAVDYESLPKNKTDWERHIDLEHGGTLQCTWPSMCSSARCCEPNCTHSKVPCTKSFNDLDQFGRHISERHFGQEKLSCLLCRGDPLKNGQVRTYTFSRFDGERVRKHEQVCLQKHT